MPIECENCGKEYDPVSTRWKCNHCGMKTSCCEGEACAPVVQSGCQECCGGEACGECADKCTIPGHPHKRDQVL